MMKSASSVHQSSDPEQFQPDASAAMRGGFASTPRSVVETLRRSAHYLDRHRGRAALNILCTAVALLSALTFPQLTQYIVDGILDRQAPVQLTMAVFGLLLAFVMRDLFSSLRTLVSNSLEQRITYDMRRDTYEHLQRLPVSYFDRMSTGDLMTRVVEDVTDVEKLLVEGTEQGAVSLATIAIVLTILFVKDSTLAAFSLIPLPFVTLGSIWFTAKARERLRAKRRSLSALNAVLLDNLQGIRQIKAFGQIEYSSHRFELRNEELRDRTMRVLNLWAVYMPAMTFFTSLGTVLIWGVGGALVLRQSISLGELVSFVFYLAMLYAPLINIHGLNTTLQSARAAGERLFDIMDEADEAVLWGGYGAPRQPVLGNVAWDAVSFRYGSGPFILKEVSLNIERGQTVALVGATGSGKSTIANLLLGFYKLDGGRILIDGQDIRSLSLDALRRQISFVSQEPVLFHATVRENILYGRRTASQDELLSAATAARCDRFIAALPNGYDTMVGERGGRLSAGEKQRIEIARALLKNAPILILDEATANIDSVTERAIQDAVRRVRAGGTSLIIAHRLSTIMLADRVVVLQGGAIVEQGTHEELSRRDGVYARMCQVQNVFRSA